MRIRALLTCLFYAAAGCESLGRRQIDLAIFCLYVLCYGFARKRKVAVFDVYRHYAVGQNFVAYDILCEQSFYRVLNVSL